jgi:hypothetical protein
MAGLRQAIEEGKLALFIADFIVAPGQSDGHIKIPNRPQSAAR